MWAWFGAALANIFGASVARFLALKIILSLIVMSILPIVLNNVFYALFDSILQAVSTTQAGVAVGSGYMASFAGLTGWMMNQFRIPEGISILLSAVSIRYALGMIPFVRL